MVMAQEIFRFLLAHWVLSGLFIVFLLALIWYEMRGQSGGLPRLSPQQVVNLMNQDKLVLIDVRAQDVFKAGHIIHARNLPLAQLKQHKALPKQKDQAIAVVCAQGQQATSAGQQLRQQGFTNVSVLAGGLQAWRAQNLPLNKD